MYRSLTRSVVSYETTAKPTLASSRGGERARKRGGSDALGLCVSDRLWSHSAAAAAASFVSWCRHGGSWLWGSAEVQSQRSPPRSLRNAKNLSPPPVSSMPRGRAAQLGARRTVMRRRDIFSGSGEE